MYERSYCVPHLDKNLDFTFLGKFKIHALKLCKTILLKLDYKMEYPNEDFEIFYTFVKLF